MKVLLLIFLLFSYQTNSISNTHIDIFLEDILTQRCLESHLINKINIQSKELISYENNFSIHIKYLELKEINQEINHLSCNFKKYKNKFIQF